MNQNFRSSLHGFNRQDVANYLEYLNNRHTAQVNQLNTDLEELRRQAQAPAVDPQRLILEARCRELEQQLRQAQTERDEALSQKMPGGTGRTRCFAPAGKSWTPTGNWKLIAAPSARSGLPGSGPSRSTAKPALC